MARDRMAGGGIGLPAPARPGPVLFVGEADQFHHTDELVEASGQLRTEIEQTVPVRAEARVRAQCDP